MKRNNIKGGASILADPECVVPNRLHNGDTSYVRYTETHEV
jgi:hypothetical protein